MSTRIISKSGEEGHIFRPDADLSDEFIKELYLIPGGEKIKECIQCGICSASCPVAYAMDYTPRQVWELLRSGQLKKALNSHTAWLCSSCYRCAVRCSAGIPFTDVMYGLKRMGVQKKLDVKNINGPRWAKTFLKNVKKKGRITDIRVMIEFMMKAKQPFRILTIIPEALKMSLKGRVNPFSLLFPKKIKERKEVKEMLEWIDNNVEIG